jgi:hypothetical protein
MFQAFFSTCFHPFEISETRKANSNHFKLEEHVKTKTTEVPELSEAVRTKEV